MAREFLGEVIAQAQSTGLTSDEHFAVDGTLMEEWASLKSFQRKDHKNGPPDDPGNPTVNFHGERRRKETHGSSRNWGPPWGYTWIRRIPQSSSAWTKRAGSDGESFAAGSAARTWCAGR